jgi:hypothetical protein
MVSSSDSNIRRPLFLPDPRAARPPDRRLAALWRPEQILEICNGPYQPLAEPGGRLPSELAGRDGAALVWTGRSLLVWGGSDGQSLRADGMAWIAAPD